tara:strand:+ start:94 stop:960 length:867 start_codon:yes stop_codon:yes gene_type:complete
MSVAQDMFVGKQQEVKGFMRVNTKEERIKQDEIELAEMKAEQGMSPEEKEDNKEPETAEERSFKKRYGDLRRHQQEEKSNYEEKIKALQGEIQTSNSGEMELPSTEAEIAAWAGKYPQVANIMQTMAVKAAREQNADLNTRMKEIDDLQETANKSKAESKLLQIHPDFEQIREDDAFHKWVDTQPKWVQDSLYHNEADATSAARAIDLYKLDAGISKKNKSKKGSSRGAAQEVSTTAGRAPTTGSGEQQYRESDVADMDINTYAEHQDAIALSMRTGNFEYDLSGNAR